jgi:hypothetical protein
MLQYLNGGFHIYWKKLHTDYQQSGKITIVYCKVKQSRYRHAGDKVERKYSSYTFLTFAPDGVEWSATRPGRALPLGKGQQVLIA